MEKMLKTVCGIVEFDLCDPLSSLLEKIGIPTGGVGWIFGEKKSETFTLVDECFDYHEFMENFELMVYPRYNSDAYPIQTFGQLRREKYVTNIRIHKISYQPKSQITTKYIVEKSFFDSSTTGYTIVDDILSKICQINHVLYEPVEGKIGKTILITDTITIGRSRTVSTLIKFDDLTRMFFREVSEKYISSLDFQNKVKETIDPKLLTILFHELISNLPSMSTFEINEKLTLINGEYERINIDDRLVPFQSETSLMSDQTLSSLLEIGSYIEKIKTDIEERRTVTFNLDDLIDLYNKQLDSVYHIGKTNIKQVSIATIMGHGSTFYENTSISPGYGPISKMNKTQLEALLLQLKSIAKINPFDSRLSIMNDVILHISK